MKSLTVGDENVMGEIWRMGLSPQPFVWKVCKKGFCEHREADLMRMVGTLAKAPGVDALSPPWSLPVADASGVGSLPGSQRTDDAGTSQPRKSVYVESTQSSLGGDNPAASVRSSKAKRKHPSPIPWAHGDIVLPAQGGGGIKNKKKKVVDDASFQGKVGEREEVNAQSFLQQSWAQAVRTNSTILVLHSGNHEIIEFSRTCKPKRKGARMALQTHRQTTEVRERIKTKMKTKTITIAKSDRGPISVPIVLDPLREGNVLGKTVQGQAVARQAE
ncbi:hypothetical protein PILCRDRAFT_748606 [Piloderma croceum F 1598]|uniref:Uncharacterized protein n=1 Tax=Piloderma croceum (strain F 1598) TaxID=765440 RepID=A0A0C3ADH4_PILCF|nr:hypothetical protein PILCRDRAFT_748606 [Piloderma croceum F 1598]